MSSNRVIIEPFLDLIAATDINSLGVFQRLKLRY